MIYKLKSIGLIALGIAMMIGAVIGQVLWLGFCFGTVIVGLFLLFAMPMILMWPAFTGVPAGFVIFVSGWTMWNEGQPYVYSAAEDARNEVIDIARVERQRKLRELLAQSETNSQQKLVDVEDVKPK